ncbi:hypothetical protein ACFFRR_007966 [Megaselia abdita]
MQTENSNNVLAESETNGESEAMVAGGPTTQSDVMNDPIVPELLKIREEHARNQAKDYSHVFRKKTRFDLIRLAAVIVGLEFAYAAETAFVTPILRSINMEHTHMTLVWGIAPFIGFFIAPLMGSISDRCRLSWGRRRPVITVLCFAILLGLFFVPYGKYFGELLGDDSKSGELLIYSAVFVVIGTILLDLDVNMLQTPIRAYMLDVSIPSDHPKALNTFTILASLGGTCGYLLGAVNWESTFLGEFLGGNIPTVFTIVTVVFILTFIVTTTSFREVPLPLMEKDDLMKPMTDDIIKQEIEQRNNKFKEEDNEDPEPPKNNDDVSLGKYLKSIVIMPRSLALLCLTNFLSWMADLCYCLYFTDFVGEVVFQGNATALEGSIEHGLYNDGIRFGCWGLAVYAGSCALYSVGVEKFIKWFGIKTMYIGGLMTYSIGMLALSVWPNKVVVILSSAAAGIIYATMFTMPFVMLASYHSKGCFGIRDGVVEPLKQKRGIGTDMAILGSMVFIAQVITSVSLGPFIALVGSSLAILYAASALALLGAISAYFLLYL